MPDEKILIMAVKKNDVQEERFLSSLNELRSLCQTAGGKVSTIITQNRKQIHPATYIGEGKAEEIKNEIEMHDIDLVISNDELSPGQIRNLSDYFHTRLIDRSQLILDIFAQRAKTKEGKLQVELAQLEYLLPRLHGQGTMLSRLGGGIGTRGPGETKLETDQRHIRRKITDIKRRLKVIVQQRMQYRERRKTNKAFQIAIVGYTNAGKSTIFNRLTNNKSLAENKLFATLDPLTRKITFPSGFQALITDTVGFIQDLPTPLIASFRSTLEEAAEADFILHVIDSSHPDQAEQQKTVLHILDDLGAGTIPSLTVYNKKDLLDEDFIPTSHPYIRTSAYSEMDIRNLLVNIEHILKEAWNLYTIHLHADKGKELHDLTQETIVTEKYFDEAVNKYIVEGYMKQDHPLQRLLKENDNRHDR
ncbi:GTPase HflX [Virgibacillus sp. W0430]|uniref:GTPase HflX n=1 Tax=Virgibacillus sp. W0430 TaxID=3391580 RepID=UPI003F45B9F5